ncbi:MAG: hypothetical protein DRP45_05665 [Candidatus Zixiibacteriota bacterium]|nr:MAG: hypothetical protein DRP45_05665 [candidate division Zixibacteria bacterium]
MSVDSRILEIVFYLMDHFQESDDQLSGISEFSSDLQSIGYSEEEISTAYNWILDHLATPGESLYSAFPDCAGANRILTDLERARLTPGAYGFLLRLFNLGVIDAERQEMILDRLGLIGPSLITAEQVKLVASAVIFNERGESGQALSLDTEADFSTQVN